jgi:predicted AlkP superfamily pyrophosphatase or phosphodiesterase
MLKNNKIHILLVVFISIIFCSNNEQEYVILVSFDGFRHDYVDRVETFYFDYVEKWGVKAKSLKPVFPSFTFPNHYAIATGCYSDKHKILGNEFNTEMGRYSYKDKNSVQDARWYGAEPIWVTAEKNDIITATYFWVGSEAKIGGYYPTYYKNYESGINPYKKVDQAIEWLGYPISSRPRLVCLYFEEPDHAGHVFGPNSIEVANEIKSSDDILGYLLKSISKIDIFDKINVVIVSDHGMVDVSENKIINIDDFNLSGILDGKGPVMSFKVDSEIDFSINELNIPNVSIVPSKNNNNLNYHNSLYDYLFIANEGWMMYKSEHIKQYNGKLPVKGMHGYHSDYMNMHAIFYAYGPRFKENYKIKTFELIHIYPLLCELLGINPNDNIDGDLKVLKSILK